MRRLVKSRRFQFFGGIVRRVDVCAPVVALTLDDGPHPAHGPAVVELLRGAGVPATFFVVGEAAQRAPQLLRSMVADGHELGNHGYTHRRMVLMRTATIRAELEGTDAVIRAAGQRGAIHFRPPYCAKAVALPRYLARTGRRTITWDVEPESAPGPAGSAEEIVRRTLDAVRPGSIVLLHPMSDATADTRAALPAIVAGLRANGYALVTVSQLLACGARTR